MREERSSKTKPSSWQRYHVLSESNPDSMSAHAMCTGPVHFGAYNKALDAVKELIFVRHADEVKCTSDFGIGHESEAHARLLLIRMFG